MSKTLHEALALLKSELSKDPGKNRYLDTAIRNVENELETRETETPVFVDKGFKMKIQRTNGREHLIDDVKGIKLEINGGDIAFNLYENDGALSISKIEDIYDVYPRKGTPISITPVLVHNIKIQ